MIIRRAAGFLAVLIVPLALILPTLAAAGNPPAQQKAPEETEVYLNREIRHQLIMLPYYNIFDWFTFKVSNYDVTLDGYAIDPAIKSAAGNVVKGIEGVRKVTNNIKVLPPSTMDDHIRYAEYRAIYGYPGFEKYAIQAIGPIHIIVDSGHVILEGVVDSEGDKNIADIHAKGVPGVFSVTDNLKIAQQSDHSKG